MRPGQNKRMRGRNNRKGPNPLTRTYESNGPDVKIRGTAHHVAEKYLQLARDAQSSGDPVMAESYLQHAEHYFRLIAAAQAAQQQAQMGFNRPEGAPDPDDMDDDDDIGGLPDRFASPVERFPAPAFGNGQQPYAPQQGGFPQQQQPYQGERQPQQAAPQGQPQPFIERPAFPQQQQPYQGERQPRGDRPYQDRNNNQQGGRFQGRNNRFRGEQQPRPEVEPEAAPNGLPAFITSPTRVVDQDQPSQTGADVDQQHQEVEAGGYHLRPRRRRRPREDGTDVPPGDTSAE